MLDIGWMELMVLGIVALLVVGPKELPAMLRTIGSLIGMAKRQADEFRAQFDAAIRESEFDDVRRQMDDIRHGRFNDPDATKKTDDDKTDDNKTDDKPRETSKDDDAHLDGQGPIEPAPEFRDDQFRDEKPTDSFTMADGTVVTKTDPAATPDTTPEPTAEPTSEAAPTDATPPDAPANDADETPPKRNAEAVR